MPLRAIDSASPVMEPDLQQNRCASGVFAMEGIPVLVFWYTRSGTPLP